MKQLSIGITLTILLVAQASAGEKKRLDPGCKAGDSIGVFTVTAITGKDKGKSLCYV